MEYKKEFTTLFFPDGIETDEIKSFIEKLSIALNEYKIIHLYFTCGGGSTTMSKICTDFMNRFKDRIKIITSWQVGSCAVDMIIDTKCNVDILDDTFMILHLTTRDIDLREIKREETGAVFLKNNIDNNNVEQLIKYKAFFNLTDKEVNIISSGNDLYLDHKRVRESIGNKG